MHRIETEAALDQLGKPVGGAVRDAIAPGPVKNALSGTWLGHAVHPMLTDVVIGSLTSATLLDVFAGRWAARASERLIEIGMAAYLPTALTGANDWADTEAADSAVRRTGLVHAATNLLALSLYGTSLAARRGGHRGRGAVLGAAGAAVLSAGGYLGGHLSLRRGVGPDQTVFDPGPSEWTRAADSAAVAAGGLERVVVQDTPVLLARVDAALYAIHDRCSHRGCSLRDGERDGETIVCACHGSRFHLRDGAVLNGPATAPQPAFETRERDGAIEVRLRSEAAG